MPTPANDLNERLARLADQAPQQLDAVDLWGRGRARARRRTWQQGGLALACLLLVGFVGGSALLLAGPPSSPPASPAEGEVFLPDELFVPSPWAITRTLEDGPPGRLVAVVGAERRTLTTSEMGFYGVSATTGEYTWLDLPDLDEAAPVSLSPDGTRVAWWLERPDPYGVHETVRGYALLDTVTGEVSRHEVPSDLGLSAEGVAWTPGSAWFQFSALTEMEADSFTASLQPTHLVDLDSGEVSRLSVTSSPGVPEAPSAEQGFVVHGRGAWHTWVAGTQPSTWERFQGIRGVQDEAVPSADGTLLAGIEAPESVACCTSGAVRVGARRAGTVRWHTVPGDDYDQVLGWRSPTQVLAVTKGRVHAVDVDSGAAEPVTRMVGTNFLQQPALATALLDAPVVPAVDRPFAVDRRALLAGAAFLALLGVVSTRAFLVWRRRARA
jgi:hypothetical protein